MVDPIIIPISVDTAAALEGMKRFARESKAAMDGATTSTEKAQKAIEELGRKMATVGAIVEKDKKLLDELSRKREEASGAAKKQADQEVENLKRVIAAREQDLLKIQEKRIKLEETVSLSNATSDSERQQIRKATQERLVANGVIRDQKKAHTEVNEEVEKGSSILGSYFGRFAGIGGVLAALNLVKQSFEEQRNEVERIISATDKFRDLNKDVYQRSKQFYNEFGIRDSAQQQKASDVLQGISSQYGVDAFGPAAGIAATLRENGVTDFNSDQFKGLVGTAGMYADKGMNPTQISALMHNMLQANPKLTGNELNQRLAGVVESAGSVGRGSELLNTFYQNRAKLEGVGFGLNETQQMWQLFRRKGQSAENIGELIGGAAQSLDHLTGMSIDDRLALKMKLAKANAGELSNMIPMRGQVDVPAFLKRLGGYNSETRAMVGKDFSGTRGTIIINALTGFLNEQLGSGTMLGPTSNPSQTAEIAIQAQNAADAARVRTSPTEATFETAVNNQNEYFSKNATKLPWNLRGWATPLNAFGPNQKEYSAAYVRSREILRLSRIKSQMENGTLKSSPADMQEIDTLIARQYSAAFTDDGSSDSFSTWRSMAFGSAQERASILGSIKNDEDFLGENVPSYNINTKQWNGDNTANDVNTGGDALQRTNAIDKKLKATTQPSTQPVSVNYHIQQTNYGYGYDNIGAPNEWENRYS